MSLDNLLMTLANLAPKNKPELEELPVKDLKVGDEVLIIWTTKQRIWKVLDFCEDGCVDIQENQTGRGMSIPFEELRLTSFLPNKFKRGDLIVYSNDLPHTNLFSVRHVADDETVVHEVLDEMGAKTFTEPHPCFYIRYATEEEIKAGRRLP